MTLGEAVTELRAIAEGMRFQSKNPYNNSTKERHVRDLLSDYAGRVERALVVLTPAALTAAKGRGFPKKAVKRGR
jgi:hypothetical protein